MTKKFLTYLAAAAVSVLLLPFLLSASAMNRMKALTDSSKPPAVTSETDHSAYKKLLIPVHLKETGEVEQLELYDYICRSVAGEMPPTYNIEALKAQAVAAYTYLAYKVNNCLTIDDYNPERHEGAYICTDSSHCIAYLSDTRARERFGDKHDEYFAKIREAVDSVFNEILVYDEKPAMAIFHSISSGKTENCEDVWGGSYPYLVSVDTPFDESAGTFLTEVKVSVEEFCEKIEEFDAEAEFGDNTEEYIKDITRSAAGGVLTLKVGGAELTGKNMRSIFGLRSTNFSLEFKDGEAVFEVKGYGHGVGMTQYGANELAKQGKAYKEILEYFYQGTEIAGFKWNGDVFSEYAE